MRERPPGRPRNSERCGREKIIDGFRVLARQSNRKVISRKDLATFLGITPALISYYFPDRDALIFEALEGVFIHWHKQMAFVAEQQYKSESERISHAIDLLLSFFLAEGHAVDLYDDMIRKDVSGDPSHVGMEDMLMRIVMQNCAAVPAQIISKLIWGACRHVAQFQHDSELVRSALINLIASSKNYEHLANQTCINTQQNHRWDDAFLQKMSL